MRERLMLRSIALVAPIIVGLANEASAAIVTSCGASKGVAYYFKNPLIPKGKTGWQDDGISSGTIQLVQNGTDFDIFYTDTVGTKSMRAEGFRVISINQPDPNSHLILAVHEGTRIAEHYLFVLDDNGVGEVAWGSLKGAGSIFPKSSLYLAKCHRRQPRRQTY